ncbi:MAG: EAL domain-containing protein [Methylobacter sp.]|nr:EAL domain-containing protein [Methylobacter sp.]
MPLIRLVTTWAAKPIKADKKHPPVIPGTVLLFIALTLVVPLIGLTSIMLHGPKIELDTYANLETIARLKSDQVKNWLDERHGNAASLAASTGFATQVDQFVGRQQDLELSGPVRDNLNTLRTAHGFDSILLLDDDGRMLLKLGEHVDTPPALQEQLHQAMTDKSVQRGELYLDRSGAVHLDWVVPVVVSEPQSHGRVVAAVVLRATAQHFLYPLIQAWSTASPAAEILLVRRQGNSVIFLNELGRRSGTAMTHLLSLNDPDLPAAAAIHEARPGTIKGRDYRGVTVLAAYRPVAGTAWHIVAKVERDNVLESLRALIYWIGWVAFSSVVTLSVALLLFWRKQKRVQSLALLVEKRKSDDLLRHFFDLPFIGMAITSPETKRWLQFNDRLCDILGYTREELDGKNWAEMTHPDDLALDIVQFERVMQGECEGYTKEKRFIRKDGAVVHTSLDVKCVRQLDGTVSLVVATVEDITGRKYAEEQLRLSAKVFEQSAEGLMITDADCNIVKVNHAFTVITGYSEADVIGRNPHLLSSGQHDQDFFLAMWKHIATIGYWKGEIWNRRKNGDVYPEMLSISVVTSESGEVSEYVAVFSDISQLKASEAQLEFLAHNDPLTALPNRRLLFSRIKHGINMSWREGKQFAVLMLDLDRFKDVNDSFGHFAGDQLLQQVAERLSSRLREVDTVARLGGDEFTVMLEDITRPEDAARVADEIIADFSEPWQLPPYGEVRIGVSIGISLYPQHGYTPEILLQQADTALYRAKAQGRGCYAYFSNELTVGARERMELEARLRRAIVQNELRVYFQPQVDIATGNIVGAEALVRWQDPAEGLIPPLRFIPLAEETGLIIAIGEWVLRETCRQGRQWLDAGLPALTLSVNVSPHQFKRSDMSTLVTAVLAETAYPAEWLELELTESGLMEYQDQAVELLNNLRAQGVRLAVDDFGTGYSSLACLKHFPLDVLKIDKSFIDEIPNSSDDMEIAATIVAMGRILGFKVLAEGVETIEQLDFLQAQGCDLYQGYLKSRPLPAEDFAVLLQESTPSPRSERI